MATQSASVIPQLGGMLRYWRQERGKSQLDLSLDTGISQRHLSFVESGRSIPSRDFLSIVSDALNIPLRERNVLLLASGYAPLYSEQSLDADQMAIVTRAIDRMLQQHEPHPALVLDRHWNVIRTNEAAPRFFGSFVDLEARPRPRNLLDLMFDPAGMRPFVEEWEEVAAGLLQRVRREAVGQVIDAGLAELLERLHKYPGVAGLKPPLAPQIPVLPITFRRGDERFSYFSLITTVGTPQCITAQELRVECMFPSYANGTLARSVGEIGGDLDRRLLGGGDGGGEQESGCDSEAADGHERRCPLWGRV
jgi:transcriptional regulator with XRE-family HTH domain